MAWTIHHVNLPAHDVRDSVAFYGKVFGMLETQLDLVPAMRGPRSEPDRLANFEDETQRSIHLVKPDPDYARTHAMPLNPTVGGHVAIRVDDLDAVKRALEDRHWPYADVGEYALPGIRQIYLYDPSMNVVEVNEAI